jgi:glucokinase
MSKIGVDFGGTRIKLARVDGDQILSEESIETPQSGGPQAVLSAIAAAVLKLDSHPEAIGLAIPGQVDPSGACYRLPNVPGFEGFRVAEFLEPRVGCSVDIENDGNAAAHGEALFGLGRSHRSFALFTLGTGVGGGIVIDGRVRTGAFGFAAEIGHVVVDTRADAPLCGCGRRGCVEAYAGTRALLRKFQEMGGTADEVLTIAQSARAGERAGLDAFAMMAQGLARGVTIIQTLLDVDAIGFTGGISASFDLLETEMRRHVRELAYAKPLGEVPLIVGELGARAGVIGAAHLHTLSSR